MPLVKPYHVVVVAGVPPVEGHPASLDCVPDEPGVNPGPIDPTPAPPPNLIYLYVPNDPTNPAAGEVVHYGQAPAPPGYVCAVERIIVPDPTMPGVSHIVERTNCYWQYP